LHRFVFRIEGFSDLFVPYRFQLQEHAAKILSDHFLFHFQFFCGSFAEQDFLPVYVHIERIHMKRIAAHCQQIHSQNVAAHILCKAPDPIPAVALGNRDLVAFDLDGGGDNIWRR
jgi:hypothetical protein